MSFAVVFKRIPPIRYCYAHIIDEEPSLRNVFMEVESGLRQACLILKPDPLHDMLSPRKGVA